MKYIKILAIILAIVWIAWLTLDFSYIYYVEPQVLKAYPSISTWFPIYAFISRFCAGYCIGYFTFHKAIKPILDSED